MVAIMGLVLLVITVVFLSQVFLGNDNPIEEAIEEDIKEQYEVNLDLSPGSPEIDKGAVRRYPDIS